MEVVKHRLIRKEQKLKMRSQVSRGILAEESSVWEGACLATILCQLITQIYLVLARKRICLERALISLGFWGKKMKLLMGLSVNCSEWSHIFPET